MLGNWKENPLSLIEDFGSDFESCDSARSNEKPQKVLK